MIRDLTTCVVSSHTYQWARLFHSTKLCCVCSINGQIFGLNFISKWILLKVIPCFLYFISLIMKKANQCYQKFNVREYPIEHWHIWISVWWTCGFYGRVFDITFLAGFASLFLFRLAAGNHFSLSLFLSLACSWPFFVSVTIEIHIEW